MSPSTQNPVVEQQLQQLKVVIPNKHGEDLVGILHETGRKEIAILCHGYLSTKEMPALVNLANALQKRESIAAFRFDFSGNGESEGSLAYGNYWREVDDLRAVIEHFRKASRVVSAILGHSKGGNVVLLYASKYQDIGTVVNISGRYDLKKGIEANIGKDYMEKIKRDGFTDVMNKDGSFVYRATEEGLIERLNTDMRKECLLINKECRVFTVHGSADKVVLAEDAFEFDKIIPNHNLRIIKGANHGYTSHRHQTKLESVVLNLMK